MRTVRSFLAIAFASTLLAPDGVASGGGGTFTPPATPAGRYTRKSDGAIVKAEQYKAEEGVALPPGVSREKKTGRLYVTTKTETKETVNPGDFVITESDGEHYYAYPPEKFEKEYDAAPLDTSSADDVPGTHDVTAKEAAAPVGEDMGATGIPSAPATSNFAPSLSIGTYVKAPLVIEAVHFLDAANSSLIAGWCGGSNAKSPDEVQIVTLEGEMTAGVGDYIIKGIKGEFYPCKADIFEASYHEVPSKDSTSESVPTAAGDGASLADEIAGYQRQIGELRIFNNTCCDSIRSVDAYCRTVFPGLPTHYGMPVDGVRMTVEFVQPGTRSLSETATASLDADEAVTINAPAAAPTATSPTHTGTHTVASPDAPSSDETAAALSLILEHFPKLHASILEPVKYSLDALPVVKRAPLLAALRTVEQCFKQV